MPRTKQLSVDDIIAYDYQGEPIEEMPYFLYEIEFWKIEANCAHVLKSSFYKTNKELEIQDSKVIKRYKSFRIMRFITLLGAPKSFIEENNLSIYIPIKKRKRNVKRKS